MQLELVGQLAARTLSVGRVIAAELVGLRAHRADHRRVLRAAEIAVGLSGGRGEAGRTDDGCPGVGCSVGDRRGPVLLEDQLVAVERRGVGEVELSLVGRREAPRVRAHELGMGVNVERKWRGVGRGEREPEFDGAPPVRGEVGAGDLQAVDRRQRHLHVAEARGEARRRPDPLAVDAEPDAVEQLDRRGPDATHLAAGVKAHGRVAAVLAAEIIGAVSRGNVAPIGEIARD